MVNEKVQKKGIARLLEISGGKKKYLLAAGTLCALGSIAKMFIYVFVYMVLLEIVQGGGIISNIGGQSIMMISFGAGVSLLISILLESGGSICSHIAAFNLTYELRMRISDKLSRLPLGYFNDHATGETKKVLNDDVDRIEHFVAHNIVDFVSGIVTPVITLVFLFFVDWRMALSTLASIPVALLVGMSLFGSKSAMELSDIYQKSIGKMGASAIEYINGMKVVKTFAKGNDIYENLNKDIKSSGENAIVWAEDSKTPYVLFQTLLPASILFIFPVAVLLLSNPIGYQTILPAVLLFFVIGTNVAEPMKQLMLLSGVFRKVSYGMECIDEILYKDELPQCLNAADSPNHDITFEDVCFAYGDTDVLHNINFTGKQGTLTALVGPSGAGKSTVAQLIARFWDIKSGSIKIGGQDIRDFSNEELMQQVSFVFQDVMMLSDTIEENIRMGNKAASMEEVVQAAKSAQIHNYIELLPDGYKTKLGEGGIYLSGGEMQRISIARIFLKNTPIVVLDEATAYADAENETFIQKAFNMLAKDKTVIIIAHRLSTIAGADQILVVDKGCITENGKHEELLNENGLYAKMWSAMEQGAAWSIGGGAA